MSSPPAPYSSLLVLLTVSVPPSDDGRKVTVLVPTRSLSTTMSPVNWTVYATLPRAKVAVSAAPGTLNIQFAGSEKSPLLSVRQIAKLTGGGICSQYSKEEYRCPCAI